MTPAAPVPPYFYGCLAAPLAPTCGDDTLFAGAGRLAWDGAKRAIARAFGLASAVAELIERLNTWVGSGGYGANGGVLCRIFAVRFSVPHENYI